MAGTIGLVQNDIKRVLAYSTVSQLGLMFLAMGVGAFGAGIFHLYTHAFFKALLFLGSGAVIHALHGEQDIRNMGGLRKALPITFWTFLIGSLAIAGVPGLAGFFSKDEILFETFQRRPHHPVGDRRADVAADGDLHVPARLPDVLRRAPSRGTAPAPPASARQAQRRRIRTKNRRRITRHTAARDPGPDVAHARVPSPGSRVPAHSHLHDAPPAMALALIVLAIGSVAAGYIGIPARARWAQRAERLARAVVRRTDGW